MESVKWASDGGYYTVDRDIIVSKENANFINNAIDQFKKEIRNEEGNDYFWLTNQNFEDLNDALDLAWQLFYDKIDHENKILYQ